MTPIAKNIESTCLGSHQRWLCCNCSCFTIFKAIFICVGSWFFMAKWAWMFRLHTTVGKVKLSADGIAVSGNLKDDDKSEWIHTDVCEQL
jgi:hypothetical protein